MYQQIHPSGFHNIHCHVRYRLILCRFMALFFRRIDPASSFARKPQTTIILSRKRRGIRLHKFLGRRMAAHIFPSDPLYQQFIYSSSMENALQPEVILLYCIQRFGPENPEEGGWYGGDQLGSGGHDYNGGIGVGNIHRSSTISPHSICGTATLSDSVPLFMLLSAWTSALLNFHIQELWMSAALSLMAHAFIEDYLCHGVPPLQALEESFAWGVIPFPNNEESGKVEDTMEEIMVNDMFGADGGSLSKKWEELREEVLKCLVPPPGQKQGLGVSLAAHLVGTVLRGVPPAQRGDESESGASLVGSFSMLEKVLVGGVLKAMAKVAGKPILAQLEKGQLDGVDAKDVLELLDTVGVELDGG